MDSHLHSTKAVDGYHIEATDGEIGHVAGFVIDVSTWAIRYIAAIHSSLSHMIIQAGHDASRIPSHSL